jgi:aspartate/methionine/tyrosine aminotransferase
MLKSGKTLSDVADTLARNYGVLILPGEVYGVEFSEYFRVGFGRENFPECLGEFQKALLKVLYE